jgi:FMN phosphatase YigB (HAD superfamily)
VEELRSRPHPDCERQETESIIAEAVRALQLGEEIAGAVVAEAMCLPARGRVTPFPGALPLLRGLAERGIRIVIVSNVTWRSASCHEEDFVAFAMAEYVSSYVTSLDVGWRKPHDAFFDSALLAAGVTADECAMVGDHDVNDVLPAVRRGMFTVRAAIEEPRPLASAADHICRSLDEVSHALGVRATEWSSLS